MGTMFFTSPKIQFSKLLHRHSYTSTLIIPSFLDSASFPATVSRRQRVNALFDSDFVLKTRTSRENGVHDNDASESSQPSWGKIIDADFSHAPLNEYSRKSPNDKKSKLEYKFQDKENSEDIFSFGSALEDFTCVVFVHDRNINQRDLPRDIPIDSIEVLRYDTKGVKHENGKMPTKSELTLE
ncbi:hypothetical protein Tco_0512627 [Tanacetum coccineum]